MWPSFSIGFLFRVAASISLIGLSWALRWQERDRQKPMQNKLAFVFPHALDTHLKAQTIYRLFCLFNYNSISNSLWIAHSSFIWYLFTFTQFILHSSVLSLCVYWFRVFCLPIWCANVHSHMIETVKYSMHGSRTPLRCLSAWTCELCTQFFLSLSPFVS